MQKAPQLPTENNLNILTTILPEKTVLVFIAGNTTFSSQLLNQLQQDTSAMPQINVIAILLTEDKQSVQNFKSIYPQWTVYTPKVEDIQKVIETYKLVYAPTIYILDKDRVIEKVLTQFERLLP